MVTLNWKKVYRFNSKYKRYCSSPYTEPARLAWGLSSLRKRSTQLLSWVKGWLSPCR